MLVLPIMVRVRFLGTGPAGGRPGRGRSHRTESSLLLVAGDGTILIDVTRDFTPQARRTGRVDLVLLTHAHRDATGGLAQLDRSLAAPTPVWASRATVRALNQRYRALAHLQLRSVSPAATLAWRGWTIRPALVPHARDCTTFAWRLEHAGFSMVYASDVARLTPALAALAGHCDLLVLDGAMWQRRLFTHLEIRSAVPIIQRWPVGRVLLTQIGRSTPDHAALDRWLHGIDPRIGAAYDGLELALSE